MFLPLIKQGKLRPLVPKLNLKETKGASDILRSGKIEKIDIKMMESGEDPKKAVRKGLKKQRSIDESSPYKKRRIIEEDERRSSLQTPLSTFGATNILQNKLQSINDIQNKESTNIQKSKFQVRGPVSPREKETSSTPDWRVGGSRRSSLTKRSDVFSFGSNKRASILHSMQWQNELFKKKKF